MQRFLFRNFERMLVLLLVASLLGINWLVEQKFAFLSFYYLPIILAGFYGGRRVSAVSRALIAPTVLLFLAAPRIGAGGRPSPEAPLAPIPLRGVLLFSGCLACR